uniref:hypothetical protein n=3 Tax=Protofrankia TaxID=2994361 RepID=UPI0013EDEF4E
MLIDQAVEDPGHRVPLLLRGCGQAESSAFRTVRHVTPYLCSSSRIDVPSRWSRRIAAYSSTFDIGGMTSG